MNIEGLAGGAAPVTTKSGTSCHTAVKSLEYIFDKVSETMIASIDPDADGKQSFPLHLRMMIIGWKEKVG